MSLENIAVYNEESLQDLRKTILLSKGSFSLIYGRCNYEVLQRQILELLREECPVNFEELMVPESAINLYTIISGRFHNNPPDALMVFGLESVLDLERLLAATNNVRDSFIGFSFPIVIWGSDGLFKQLRRSASDLNSFASAPIPFSLPDDELKGLICSQVDAAVNDGENFQIKGGEIKALEEDLEGQELDGEVKACLDFLLGWDLAANNQIDAAVEKYRDCLQFWRESNNLERQGLVLLNLGWLWENKGEAFWKEAGDSLRESLAEFESANRGDLVGKYLGYLGEVLRKLKEWDELKVLAEKGLILHEGRDNKRLVAIDYGWLAEVALHGSNWREAEDFARKAWGISDPNLLVKERALFGFLLGRSLVGLKRVKGGISYLTIASDNLEAARENNLSEYDAKLHVEILKSLRDWQFKEKQYLEAFNNKLLQRKIETQYGWRAFVGAARLEPPATYFEAKTAEEKRDLVRQIEAFSGRKADLERLVGRIKNPQHKLTVIHGQSGVGKSSILQARLIPTLQLTYFEGRDYVPVSVRVYQNWVNSLGQELTEVLRDLIPPSCPLEGGDRNHQSPPFQGEFRGNVNALNQINFSPEWILSQLRENERRGLLTILVFDQFEEFFFDNPKAESRREFYRFLEDCLTVPYLKVIFSLREDYIYYLLEFSRNTRLNIDKNYEDILYYLGNFSRQDARAEIISLTERSKITLESDLVEELVEDLAREFDGVRPIEFEVVGAQLESEEITTLKQYRQLGENPKEILVERFLEEAVKDCGEENQRAAELVLFLLTNTQNTRPLKTKRELQEDLDIEGEKLDLVLEILVGSGLVLLVPEKPENFYQLVHDYLVSFVRWKYEPQSRELELTKQQLKEALTEAIKGSSLALAHSARTLVLSNQPFDARLTAIKAGRKLFDNNLSPPTHRLSIVTDTLWQLAYKKEGELFREANRLRGHKGRVKGISFSTDGELIASASDDNTVKLWSRQGKELKTLRGHEGLVNGVNFSPDGELIASVSSDKTMKLWSRQGKELQTLRGHESSVYVVSFSPDGELIASASDDKMVKLWNCQGKELQTLRGHEGRVNGVSFSPDGELIASASDDNTVKLWSRQGKELQTLRGHEGLVNSVSFSPNGELIASVSSDKTVKLWNRQGKELQTLRGHRDWVNGVSFSPDGELIASVSDDKAVKLWSRQGKDLQTLRGHEGGVNSVSFSLDGDLIATASSDNTVKLWSCQGKELKTLRGHEGLVYGVSFSPDGELIASASDDNTVKLWSCQGKELQTLRGHEGRIYGVSFNPDGDLIATASSDNTVKLWSCEGKELQTLRGHKGLVIGVSFSPDGELIATASSDNTVKLWSRQGKELRNLKEHEDWIRGVSFNPDGDLIATASSDNTVKLWSRQGKELKTLRGHEGSVNSVSFSPDGELVATASDDKTVKLWSREGEELQTLRGHKDWVIGVSFSPDGELVASASVDKTVILWDVLDFNELMKLNCQWVGDYLNNNPDVEESDRRLCDGFDVGE